MRLKSIVLVGTFLVLCGCGGGGGGGGGNPTPVPSAALACGATPPAKPSATAENVQPILVTASVDNTNIINIATTTVTVCKPGTAICVTIPNVQIDTGSTGLRLLHSLIASLNLPQLNNTTGDPYGECLQFADGEVWGGLGQVDLQFTNGARAAGITIQMIDDDGTQPTPPAPLAGTTAGCNANLEDTAGGSGGTLPLGANGIIGVGLFLQDCGPACALPNAPLDQTYFDCPPGATNSATTTTCYAVNMAVTAQVSNPVSLLAANNNGVILELDEISAAGAASVPGYMIFGISASGSGTNNALASTTPVLAVPDTGDGAGSFTTAFNGSNNLLGFFDSGSSVYFFADSSIPSCTVNAGFFCPATTQTETMVLTGSNGASGQVQISVANADAVFGAAPSSYAAFNNIGAPLNGLSGVSGVDFGLPFFYGNTMYTGFENQTVASTSGPFFACAPGP